jgi:hypothetical protein
MFISKYEKGYPCKMGNVIGRLVGESGEGTWAEINGMPCYSVPLFSTPHGTVIKTGLLRLKDLTEEDAKLLEEYEREVIEDRQEVYGGLLQIEFLEYDETQNET